MKALIIGGAGVLGAALAEKFLTMGFSVTCLDTCRIDEAWRLYRIRHKIKYVWKASTDLRTEDLRGIDFIVDGGLGVPDRPMGNASPIYTMTANIHPPLHILETINRLGPRKPIVIYPSSFNTLYGYPNESIYDRTMLPNPSSLYGWTKAAVELLYRTYFRAYGIPYVITRVGSGYGPRMRSDELPARLIIDILHAKSLTVRSPFAKRLWTYIGDIVHFYEDLANNLGEYVGQTLHCAGNAGNRIITNIDLARMLVGISERDVKISSGEYEPGEIIGDKPLSFGIDTRTPLWKSEFTLEQGMQQTYKWFKDNISRYG